MREHLYVPVTCIEVLGSRRNICEDGCATGLMKRGMGTSGVRESPPKFSYGSILAHNGTAFGLSVPPVIKKNIPHKEAS
ncbi:hypothetical protein KPH14_005857 [Odynerus spinipes]|uniref:Uncharacterized protein n=1 Tax=Odynerus spinipes TaxID=1348599 RepID=A0AAD9RBS0_9HYME|nr:hypothetical protein KPH14_005857 [Odynerus spinipes]